MSDNKGSSATTISARKDERATTQAGAVSKWLLRKLFEGSGRPPVRLRLWDGSEVSGSESPVATLRIRDRSTLMRLISRPDLYFGEAYMTGGLEVEGDLVQFLVATYRAQDAADTRAKEVTRKLVNRRKPNSLIGSRSNIHHHYDIGNEFYKLWLDTEAMQYTCAYFPHAEVTLEQAQVAKLDHVCRKLRLKPGESVVEAGCGWGGLARHLARHYGVQVRAFNISQEQIKFAREKAREEGLDNLVEYVEDDYRNISGQYDAFVSVGMLEHVGPEHYRELGSVVDRALTPNGRGLIHTIGRNRASGPMNPWIEKRIFPGAYPPSLREMMDIFEPNGFSVQDVENLRLHYATTLAHWLERFEDNQDAIKRMFDEPFIRAWRLYLAGSIATFLTGHLQLFQVVFNRATDNSLPWTREHLYKEVDAD